MTPLTTPEPETGRNDLRRTIWISVGVFVTYYVTAKIGFEFVLQPGSISALWMPNSLLLAGLLLAPSRYWWLVIFAALPAHIASEIQSGVPILMILSWFISNSVQALIGAGGMRYFFRNATRLDNMRSLIGFLICCAFLAPFLSSFLDSGLVKLNGWGNDDYWDLWRLRFLSNVLATLTLVPFVLAWANTSTPLFKRKKRFSYLEFAGLFTALFAVSLFVFTTENSPVGLSGSRLYWPLPFLVLATVRFGLRGISLSLLIVMFLAILGATKNAGPFIYSTSENNALALQGFLIFVSISLLALAVVLKERSKTELELARINQRHQAILRAFPDVMFLQDKNGVYIDYYTQDPEKLLVSPASFLGKTPRQVLPSELGNKIAELISRLRETEEAQIFEYTMQVGTQARHFEARIVNAEGDHALSIVRDVTDARLATDALKQSEKRLQENTRQIRALAAQLITAQESERRRIAILLHDDVGQNVATLGIAISRLKQKWANIDEASASELQRLSKQVQDLTGQIRQLSHQLHPEVLEHLGLVKALESQVAEFSDAEQLAIEFSADVKTSPVPLDVAVAVYRVALEAVRNVSKHSGANSANVVLQEKNGFIELEVSDSGHGFDVESARYGSGLGLLSSEERVRLLQGTLEIRSQEQRGTSLIARIPLSKPS